MAGQSPKSTLTVVARDLDPSGRALELRGQPVFREFFLLFRRNRLSAMVGADSGQLAALSGSNSFWRDNLDKQRPAAFLHKCRGVAP